MSMQTLTALIADPGVVRAIFVASAGLFVAFLIGIPLIVARLPASYFQRSRRSGIPWSDRHPLVWVPLLIAKNLLALVCVAAGILMLVLPGQGILTIIVGVLLLDFPGKYRVERWLVSKPVTLRVFNRIRAATGQQPFEL